MALSGLLRSLGFAQTRTARAQKYVRTLMEEPDENTVRALAAIADADEDHARWELRYARRAIGQLIAQRDALNDQTASDVAASLEDAHRGDIHVAAERRTVSDRQFNERLRAYSVSLADRSGSTGTSERLGRTLLNFARGMQTSSAVAIASDFCATTVLECNAALREAYGEAALPEDRRPSELGRTGGEKSK